MPKFDILVKFGCNVETLEQKMDEILALMEHSKGLFFFYGFVARPLRTENILSFTKCQILLITDLVHGYDNYTTIYGQQRSVYDEEVSRKSG